MKEIRIEKRSLENQLVHICAHCDKKRDVRWLCGKLLCASCYAWRVRGMLWSCYGRPKKEDMH